MSRRRDQQLSLPLVPGPHAPRRRGGLRRRLFVGALGCLLILLLGYTAFVRATALRAPHDERGVPTLQPRVLGPLEGLRRAVDGGSLANERGVWQLDLTGTARARGFAQGTLLARRTAQVVPAAEALLAWSGDGLAGLGRRLSARWALRRLPRGMPPDAVVELASLGRAVRRVWGSDRAPFRDLVLQQAFVELAGDWAPEAASGTVALAAWGSYTRGGGLLVGRTFALADGTGFERDKVVTAVRADHGLPFVAVGWPGMVGVVTGINRRRLVVALNPANSDQPLRSGTPGTLIARAVLREAATIRRGLVVLRRHEVMSAFCMLIADGKVPEAVIVEASPAAIAVRRVAPSAAAGFLVATDHLRHSRHSGDAVNERFRRHTSSGRRHDQLTARLGRLRGKLEARSVLGVLRDRSSRAGRSLPLGHPSAVDNARAVHGVVVDAARMTLWVSRGPRLQGPFVAFDLARLLDVPATQLIPASDLPADPVSGTPEAQRFRWASAQLREARRLAQAGKRQPAIGFARRAVQSSGQLPQTRLLLADLLWREGAVESARRQYREFLRLDPDRGEGAQRATARLRRR